MISARAFLPSIVLAVAGVLVLVLGGDGATTWAVGYGLLGVAAVLAVSLAFYAVGRSEDRDRERMRRP